MKDLQRYVEFLTRAKEFSKNHRLNPLEQGNLFTVLDMENKEVSAHSAFLYFVFKPFQKADDSYDDYNLRCLLEVLLKKVSLKTGRNSKNINEYSCLDIRREVSVEFGRLDFLITADDEIFVVELKIWAGEQDEQIPRYKEYLKQHGADENNIFFLTPSKRDSKTGDSINITLKTDIRQVLKEIIKEREKDYEKYVMMIEQYISIIDKITQEEDYMNETLDVIKTAEDLKAVDYLIENRNYCMQQIIIKFFDNLREKLTDKIELDGCPEAKIVPYKYGQQSINKYYSESNLYPALAYEIQSEKLNGGCKLRENVKLYFFIEIGSNLYCGITPRKITGQNNDDLQYIDCKDAIEPYQLFYDKLKTIKKAGHTKTFAIWKHVKVSEQNINFSIDALKSKESVVHQLTNDTLLIDDERINELVIEIKNSYKTFCNVAFDINNV